MSASSGARPGAAEPDGLDASEMMIEVFEAAGSEAPGLEGRLKPRDLACPLDAKVLVMSDEILLRIVLAEALGFAGVGVLQAADAAEAAEILAERRDIGVVVADVGALCRVDEIDLAWRCSVEHPDVPLVLVSALLEPDSLEIPPGVAFMRKPFTPDLLVQVIKPLLDAQASAGEPHPPASRA
jgi:two-component system, response regulator PdtaR